jgi:hypothetical protein
LADPARSVTGATSPELSAFHSTLLEAESPHDGNSHPRLGNGARC